MNFLLINFFLISLLLVTTFFIFKTTSLISVVALTGAFTLLCSAIYVNLDAVDVAFTEASVGAGISTILFLAAMAYLPKEEEENLNSQILPAISCMVLGGIFIWCRYDLPEIGLLSSPIHQHIVPDYILGTQEDIDIPNIVTAVLASYRGYDTFRETIVVFTAGVAVLALLKNNTKASKQNNNKSKKKVGKHA